MSDETTGWWQKYSYEKAVFRAGGREPPELLIEPYPKRQSHFQTPTASGIAPLGNKGKERLYYKLMLLEYYWMSDPSISPELGAEIMPEFGDPL
jgi:hypothetical protein